MCHFVYRKKDGSPKITFYADGNKVKIALPDWQIGSGEKIDPGDRESQPADNKIEEKIPLKPLW